MTDDRVSLSIPSYDFPHSIRHSKSKVKRGQQIELRGEVTRIDETASRSRPMYAQPLNRLQFAEGIERAFGDNFKYDPSAGQLRQGGGTFKFILAVART
ncbi:hypothetical protein [Mesorhizobium sp.]|uniref:hypothetical protein n=1 Tax=Mesorhizobium sp. TaxID=1871066 RepID=UPI0025CFBEFF|nr:hypothetical protein [Mesorhizobium sp.]